MKYSVGVISAYLRNSNKASFPWLEVLENQVGL